MSGKAVLASVLGLGGLALGAALLIRESGPFRERVALPDVTATTLDTVSVRGRRVEVSLEGTVTQIGPGDDVWLETGGDAVALVFPEAGDLEVEDRLLAVGRLRSRGGRRWVDVESWARVETGVRPPSEPGL
ncbi:hypothetical protein [Rubrivirga marina]|uniref:DUF5666 domain-containing protein n=1 Tax=Rubrivirga marina TaxID=1196024 RepID=A0A271J1S0_9BACT|nr:hypothetical protein [Rubrivirga marina]PAP76905.1 hypothetical protein BSZ37_10920 [Rubrivirga marina]